LTAVEPLQQGGDTMEKQPDYWTGWMDGWAAATNAIFSAQHRQGVPPRPAALEMSLAAAGDKPMPRKRGRPRKNPESLALEPPKRKRGRPPKDRPA
jgi:hypothetical protein